MFEAEVMHTDDRTIRMNLTVIADAPARQGLVAYEGRSKSSRPDPVPFRIGLKLKYYLLLIVARLRTRHAQYDLSYKHFVHSSV